MAKVEGPLFSLEARGKVGNAMVFFPWKGRHVVRQWLKPTNPSSILQGFVRCALKAIGKEVTKIGLTSLLYTAELAKVPAGLNWNAFHGQGFLASCIVGNAFQTTAFSNLIEEYSTHTATTAWNALATTLGLADFAFGYGYTDTVPAGFQLYAGALAAYANSASWGSAYTDAPSALVASDITAFYSAHL
jgi:hypothetical protein